MVIHISKSNKVKNVTPPENMTVYLTGRVMSFDDIYLYIHYDDAKSFGFYRVKIREFMNLPIIFIPPLLNNDGSVNKEGIYSFINDYDFIRFAGTYRNKELVNISNFGFTHVH